MKINSDSMVKDNVINRSKIEIRNYYITAPPSISPVESTGEVEIDDDVDEDNIEVETEDDETDNIKSDNEKEYEGNTKQKMGGKGILIFAIIVGCALILLLLITR